MVRAATGVGSLLAQVAGTNSSVAFSEQDMLRQRVAHIGTAGDTEIMNLNANSRVIVSVPAGTKIFVVFTKRRCEAGAHPSRLFVLKATLDGAAGENLLASIIAALFLMSLSATLQLMQGWNSGGQCASTDMLTSLWNYIVGQIMPAAAGLTCVGAMINFVRHTPWTRMVFAISFLSVSGLLSLFRAMAA